MFDKHMDTTLSPSLNGDLDSTSSGGGSLDNSVNRDNNNMHSPLSYGSVFLSNSGELLVKLC